MSICKSYAYTSTSKINDLNGSSANLGQGTTLALATAG
jgi:hypothetical protein